MNIVEQFRTVLKAAYSGNLGRLTRRCAVALLVLGWGMVAAQAQTNNIWIGGSGDFNTGANWDTGTAPVDGDNTTFTNDTSYTVSFSSAPATINSNVFNGHAGTVTLDIGSQTWTVTNVFSVGQTAGATASVAQVSGTVNVPTNGSFVVGDGGVGTYVLSNGTITPLRLIIGNTGTGRGTMVVRSAGVVNVDGVVGAGGGTLIIGRVAGASYNSLILSNNASISTGGATIGFNAAATNNTLQMEPGSFWFPWARAVSIGGFQTRIIVDGGTISECGTLLVGDGLSGKGGVGVTFILTNNAYLLSGYGNPRIGNQVGSYSNTMIVTSGSIWNPSSDTGNRTMILGASGNSSNNTLIIKSGGVVTNVGQIQIGNNSSIAFGSNSNAVYVIDGGKLFSGVVTVGSGIMLTNNYYQVGGIGAASLVSNAAINLGANTNAFGNSMVVTNADLFTGGANCNIGNFFNSSSNVVQVLAGATWKVGTVTLSVGGGQSSSNLLVVNGGTITNVNRIVIGAGNNTNASIANTVTIFNGGRILNCGSLVISSNTNDNYNTLSVGVGGLLTVLSNLNVGASGATLSNTFNIAGGKVVLNSMRVRITNFLTFTAGTLNTAGTTIDSGANNGAPVVVGDGVSAASWELAAGGTGFHNFNDGLVITNNATLRGEGTLLGNVTILGTISPGFSVGTIVTSNSLMLGSSAVLAYDLGTTSDFIEVNGNLTLDGTINISDSGGFGLGDYTLMTYTGTLTDNGLTVGSTPDGSLTYTIDTSAAGLVVLHVTSGGGDPYTTWASFYGLTGGDAAGGADPDGDGLSNTNEFLAGFNPTNSAAYLHIISQTRSGNDLMITYLGAGGDSNGSPGPKTNVLEFTTGTGNGGYSNNFVSTGQTNELTGNTGLGVVASFVETNGATGAARYYRVRVLTP
jgi:fibronectin-binding autotransporter adhesin